MQSGTKLSHRCDDNARCRMRENLRKEIGRRVEEFHWPGASREPMMRFTMITAMWIFRILLENHAPPACCQNTPRTMPWKTVEKPGRRYSTLRLCYGNLMLPEHLEHLRKHVFKSSDGLFNLDVWLWFSFPPLILSFHRPCAPRQPRWSLSHHFGRDPSHSMHLANSVSRLSHPFHLPVPRNQRNLLLPPICLNFFCCYICMIWPVLATLPSPLCS